MTSLETKASNFACDMADKLLPNRIGHVALQWPAVVYIISKSFKLGAEMANSKEKTNIRVPIGETQ